MRKFSTDERLSAFLTFTTKLTHPCFRPCLANEIILLWHKDNLLLDQKESHTQWLSPGPIPTFYASFLFRTSQLYILNHAKWRHDVRNKSFNPWGLEGVFEVLRKMNTFALTLQFGVNMCVRIYNASISCVLPFKSAFKLIHVARIDAILCKEVKHSRWYSNMRVTLDMSNHRNRFQSLWNLSSF